MSWFREFRRNVLSLYAHVWDIACKKRHWKPVEECSNRKYSLFLPLIICCPLLSYRRHRPHSQMDHPHLPNQLELIEGATSEEQKDVRVAVYDNKFPQD